MTTPLHHFPTNQWQKHFTEIEQREAIEALENGKILFFPQLPFELTPEEQLFLSPQFVDPKSKNISFNIHTLELRGVQASLEERENLKKMLHRFAEHSCRFIYALFPGYREHLLPARTSFRPIEIKGRKTSYRKDDKRLHVDAFPANPNRGKRILRVFTNVHPSIDRVWKIGEPFESVVKRFAPEISSPLPGSALLLKLFRLTRGLRSDYDYMMLKIHNKMKGNHLYQKTVASTEIQFPPGSTWIVQTDQVSHAALSGQHLLEQTFHLPVNAMRNPEHSPLKVLEKFLQRKLV